MARISLNYPDTGLTISISVYNRETGVLVYSGTMTEVEGVYKYDFKETPQTDYVYVATTTGYDTMRGVVYREWEIGARFNSLTTLNTKLGDIYNKIDNTKIIETIDIAKNDIITTIKTSSDSLEKEICGDIKTINKELKEDNIAARQLVRQKTKKLDENIAKLSDRQTLLDKTIEDQSDSIEDELEEIYSMECDMIEKDREDAFNKEADSIEESIDTAK